MARHRFIPASQFMTAILVFGVPGFAAAAEWEFGGDLAVGTDFAFRGISQTMASPALFGSLDVESDSGWFAYVWASNVDFVPEGEPDDGADWEFDLAAGYTHSLSERAQVSMTFVRYMFPGMLEEIRYDYNEWIACVMLDDSHSLMAGYTSSIFGSGESALYYAAGTGFELPFEHWLSVDIGRYELQNAYGASYNHAALSISRSLRNLTWDIAYHVTSDGAAEIFGEKATDPRFILTLNLSF